MAGNRTFISKQIGRGSPLQFKLLGDWDKTIRILNRLSPEIKKCSLKAQIRICDMIKQKVQGHLINQDLGWKSLSPNYAKKKQDRGLDGRTLIAYGHYYHAIQSWTIGTRHLALVGVKRGIYTKALNGKRSKLEVAMIASLHEFSSGKRFPRRPLWNPTIMELGGKEGVKNLFIKHFLATMRRNGIPIRSFKKIL